VGDGAVTSESEKRRIQIEVAVVVLLLWVPAFWHGVELHVSPPRHGVELVDWVRESITCGGMVAVLLFLMGGSPGNFVRFGFRRVRPVDYAVFACAFVVAFLLRCSLSYIANVLQLYHETYVFQHHAPLADVPMAVVVAASTEIFLRGYLLTRFIDLWESPWLAVLLAALMGSVTQFCYGPILMTDALLSGLTFGAVFVRRRSIWPVVGAHAVLKLIPAVIHLWQFLSA
jgi:membrane protease YdiL (CAAX protease family)